MECYRGQIMPSVFARKSAAAGWGILLAAIWVFCTAGPAICGPGPENTVVVVNADSAASKCLANEFINLRGVPACNVIYLTLGDLANYELIDVNVFRERILDPVFKEIESRGLAGQIDCIAYSTDFPYAVQTQPDAGSTQLSPQSNPLASINSVTYLHYWVSQKLLSQYLNLNSNLYFGRSRPSPYKFPNLTLKPESSAKFNDVNQLLMKQKYDQALPLIQDIITQNPGQAMLHFILAKCLAKNGKDDDAIAALKDAHKDGMRMNGLSSLQEFQTLVKKEEFQKLEQDYTIPLEVAPPRAFSASEKYASARHGAASQAAGPSFMLCTMLGYTSGRGNSMAEALECLRRGASADGTRPAGTIYFMTNNDVRTKTRRWAYDSAVAELAKLSVAGKIVQGNVPEKSSDVAGLSAGIAGFSWQKSGSTILPGAICEHLTSCGGIMAAGGGQTPLSEFIRYGASGASGTVTEPYAIQSKFPNAFVQSYYASGCTLAEAFYLSVAGPYQLLIVGDPLCRPWAKIPKVSLEGLPDKAPAKGTLALKPSAQTDEKFAPKRFELYLDGKLVKSVEPGKTFEFDTTAIADGWHELRTVVVCNDSIETRGSLKSPLTVANTGKTASCKTARTKANIGDTIRLSLAAAGAKNISVVHNGRTLKSQKGDKGVLDLPAAEFGAGKISLQAVAEFDDAGKQNAVLSEPLEIEIALPVLPPIQTQGNDIKIAVGKGPLQKADLKGERGILTGIKAGEQFAIVIPLDAKEDGVHQIQVCLPGKIEVRLDKQVLSNGEQNGWNMLLANLGKGSHELTLIGQAAKDAEILDVRFGLAGVKSLLPKPAKPKTGK